MPTSGGLVISPVHRSNLDFLLACLASPRRVRWMAKHSIFKGGLDRPFLYAMGAVPGEPGRRRPDAAADLRAALDARRAVVMFPEGRRKEGDTVEDLFDGPALRGGTPAGADRAHRHRRLRRGHADRPEADLPAEDRLRHRRADVSRRRARGSGLA